MAAAAPAANNAIAHAGQQLLAVAGQEVDYYSQTYDCWTPTRISKIDMEKGEIYIESRSAPLNRTEFLKRVRPRARPSTAELEWIRKIMNGKIEEESDRLFLEFSDITVEFDGEDGGPTRMDALTMPAMFKVGAWIDRQIGISGTSHELKRRAHADMRRRSVTLPPGWKAKKSSSGLTYYFKEDTLQAQWDWPGTGRHALVLTKGPFNESFWETLQRVFQKYAIALQRDRAQGARNPAQDYQLGKVLGEGTYGKVYMAEHLPTGQRRAVKSIKRSRFRGDVDQANSEIGRMRMMDHPHIVKLYEHWTDDHFIYLAMDFCSGGELGHRVKAHKSQQVQIEECIIADLMRQILRAVGHMHAHGLMHLDLKPANVVLMEERGTLPPAKGEPEELRKGRHARLMTDPDRVPHVMVIDFGLSKVFQPWSRYGDRCGTPITMAPEVWNDILTPLADVFSCGAILYNLLTFAYPFAAQDRTLEARDFWNRNQKYKPFAEIPAGCTASAEAIECCQAMMAVHRMDRPTASVALRHRFFHAPDEDEAELGIKIEEKVAQRMKKLAGKDALHKSVALRLAGDWSANRLGSIKKAFQEMDKEGTGRLTIDQLEQALKLAGVDAETARKTADAMDLTRNGQVGWSEFVASCLHLGDQNMDDDLKRMFAEVDEDGDGKLEKKDLLKMLTSEYLQADGAEEIMDKVFHGQDNVDFGTFRRHFISAMPGDLDFMCVASRQTGTRGQKSEPGLPDSPRADRVQSQGQSQRRKKSTSRRRGNPRAKE